MATTAAVLSIGDELVLGQIGERNGQVIAAALLDLGIPVTEHRIVADDCDAIAAALRALAATNELLVATGGLGPTDDDLTREALAQALGGEAIVEDAGAREALERRFARRGIAMPALNLRQATRPESARTLPNSHGTAPGLSAMLNTTRVYCLPGPPNEMEPMLRAQVVPELAARSRAGAVRTLAIHTCGLAEAEVAERLGSLMGRSSNPLVGTTATAAIVSVRLRAWGSPATNGSFERVAEEVRGVLAPFVFGEGATTVAGSLGAQLSLTGSKLAIAESCTGGMVSELVTSVPGSSRWFAGGWVTYSNEMKLTQLGVDDATMSSEGAVSAATARAMAEGAATRAGVRFGVSLTGIAGPEGGTPEKPVGTVWVGVFDRDTGHPAHARCFLLPGDRDGIRTRASRLALQWTRMEVAGVASTRLIWQTTPP